MKKIEITPEWILDKLTVTHYADGLGKITITADTVSDSRWIDLALDTINVKYESDILEYDPDPEDPDDDFYFEISWQFRIEEVKDDCPNLYVKWMVMNLLNSIMENKN